MTIQSIGRSTYALVLGLATIGVGRARGCMYHFITGRPEPVGVDLSDPVAAAARLKALDAGDDAAIEAIVNGANVNGATGIRPMLTPGPTPSVDATVSSWIINTTGATGKSTNTTINNAIKTISADVQQVKYTTTNVYVKATGIPDYDIGPFNGNPNVPANANATFDITRTPTAATTKTATGGGPIGVMVNGVAVFNAWDGTSYNNQNVWHPNAGKVEAPSFDPANGHPQQQGVYHNHENPTSLLTELGAQGATTAVPTIASPILGYAIDGYPIYGPFGTANANGTGAIVRMTSSYQLRTNETARTSLADGTPETGAKAGPAIGTQYPLGYYEEDYQYVAGSGMLDQYNGRFVVTPDFPNGTYAYFASTDATGAAAYPYFVGPNYYGVVQTDDLPNGIVTIPADAVTYTPSVPEPAAVGATGIIAGLLLKRRRR